MAHAIYTYQTNKRLWTNIGLMLAHRLRRWSNISPTLVQRLVSAGYISPSIFYTVNKWNESGFRPPLCTYRLNWARRTSWGWWDDWDDTVLQTQDSKFEPWRSEAEHATSRSRRLPTILTFTRGWGRNNFVSFKPPRPGTEPRTLAWKAAVLTTTLGPPPTRSTTYPRNLDLNITELNRRVSFISPPEGWRGSWTVCLDQWSVWLMTTTYLGFFTCITNRAPCSGLCHSTRLIIETDDKFLKDAFSLRCYSKIH